MRMICVCVETIKGSGPVLSSLSPSIFPAISTRPALFARFGKVAAIGLTLVIMFLALSLVTASASSRETDFLAKLQGNWSGSGRVLAGPDRGTNFECNLAGKPSRTGIKISMNGKCSVGRLSARMGASIKYSEGVGKYVGRFLNGARGNGLDIYGDRAGNKLKLRLTRGRTQGNMDLLLQRKDLMRVIISVYDPTNRRSIPVIALDLKKSRKSAALE